MQHIDTARLVQGVGVSLRSQHFSDFLRAKQPIDWLEIVADQFIGTHGILRDKLLTITQDYPVNLHCLSMSLAGSDPLNFDYLKEIKILQDLLQPNYISDHLCWASHQQQYSHDLLPFPYQKDFLAYIANRIQQVQDYFQAPLLLENLSHYVQFKNSEMSEAEFLNELCTQAGCGLLLDINNVYVSSENCHYDALSFIQSIKPQFVKQCHLAGHHQGKYRLIDTHGAPIDAAVWDLYTQALDHIGAVATCLEWDNCIPGWQIMLNTCQKIEAALSRHNNKHTALAPLNTLSQSLYAPRALDDFQNKFWANIHNHADLSPVHPSSIHQNSTRLQRLEALESIYPCTQHLLGKERFYPIALGYVLTTPSFDPDISANMHGFCDYLVQALIIHEKAILDVAEYEWAWYSIFHGSAQEVIDITLLAEAIEKQGDQIQLIANSKQRPQTYQCPVQLLWIACQPEYKGPSAKESLDNYQKMNYHYTMYQQDGLVITEQLDKCACQCLELMEKPITLANWCDKASDIEGFDPNLAAHFYQQGLIKLV